ncbi:porin [Undibacterium arcticum]
MQLAIALGGAMAIPAMAQTSVSVAGVIDTYVGSLKYSGDSGRTSVVNSSGMTTSWIGFKGSEDLGNGLNANFKLTSFFRSDTGASGRFNEGETLFSRDANVGLSGSFGAVSLGRDLAPNFLPSTLFNPFGGSFKLSPLMLHMDVPRFNASGWTNSVAGDTGWSNEIIYTTPNFAGLKANLHYQFGEVAGNTGKK